MNDISGIQQIGIGIPDVVAAKLWYRDVFGMGAQVFDDEAQAKLMTKYTNGIAESRRAVLSLNMAGGGGMEIWQYTSKIPVKPSFKIHYGDLGIYAAKIKTPNVEKAHKALQSANPSSLYKNPENDKGHDWFDLKDTTITGGVYGAIIGVSDIDAALKLYKNVMGVDTIIYDKTGIFEDINDPEVAGQKYRRLLLRKKVAGEGAFGKMLGGIEMELVQALDRKPNKIFEGRCWGDAGYIHLCFDVLDMASLQNKCTQSGFPFTVDSGETFDMGDGGGRFTYCEDPDGTLIEMVETHRVPIFKKIGWYLNLNKRDKRKPLPDWMVK
ncbi:MAG: VOC family protein, partial [Bacteroidetes bacterium]|nr:VOC family protein [Bacteroidota bacterium]